MMETLVTDMDAPDWVERTLRVAWQGGGVTPIARPHDTGWRILPFTVVAELSGEAVVMTDDATIAVRAGQAICAHRGRRHRVTLTSERAVSRWAHVDAQVLGGLDLPGLLAVPTIVSGMAARALGDACQRLVEVGRSTRIETLLRRQERLLDLLSILAAEAPADRALRGLREAERFAPVLAAIDDDLAAPHDVASLAARVALSPPRFHALFRAAFGLPPMRFVQERRIRTAQQLLLRTSLPVQEIGARCGYPDPFHFSRIFKQRVGSSPSGYRRLASDLRL